MHENSVLVRAGQSMVPRDSILGALEVSEPAPLMYRSLAPVGNMRNKKVVFTFRPQLSAFAEANGGCDCLIVENGGGTIDRNPTMARMSVLSIRYEAKIDRRHEVQTI